MTRILYPGKVEPTLPSSMRPEQVTESRWHQPWSEPVRLRTIPVAEQPTTVLVNLTTQSTAVIVPVPGWTGMARRITAIGAS